MVFSFFGCALSTIRYCFSSWVDLVYSTWWFSLCFFVCFVICYGLFVFVVCLVVSSVVFGCLVLFVALLFVLFCWVIRLLL